MPGRRKNQLKKKAPSKRRNLKKYYSQMLYTNGAVMSTTKVVNLAYHDTQHLSYGGIGGAPVYVNYRINSIYDPYYATGGGQPMGHDQWADLYDHYKVLGARCTATFMWRSGTGQIHRCGLLLDHDDAPAIDYSQVIEQTHARNTGFLKPDKLSMVKLKANFSSKTFYDNRYADADTGAGFGYNPVAPGLFRPWVFPIDTAPSAGEVTVDVLIEYIVQLSQPKPLGRS